jgi:hypothetical protein
MIAVLCIIQSETQLRRSSSQRRRPQERSHVGQRWCACRGRLRLARVSWERQSDGRFHGGRRRVDDAHESGLDHFGICHGLRDYDGGIFPYFFSISNVAELVDDIGCTDGTVLEGATVETLQRLLSAVGALHVSRRT